MFEALCSEGIGSKSTICTLKNCTLEFMIGLIRQIELKLAYAPPPPLGLPKVANKGQTAVFRLMQS